MTWMEVRDALKAGKTTVIVPTGGTEKNGYHMVLGKHNYVVTYAANVMARRLKNALVAPTVQYVPEGEPDTSVPGEISLPSPAYDMLLDAAARSLRVHGFKEILFIGDSGGNQAGMKAVAEKLNAQWNGNPVVAHIPEYYDYASVGKLLTQLGVTKEGDKGDGLHDDPGITMNMFITDPQTVRWDARVKAGKATINGVSIADKAKTVETAKKIVDMRATNTVAAIKKAIANRGKASD